MGPYDLGIKNSLPISPRMNNIDLNNVGDPPPEEPFNCVLNLIFRVDDRAAIGGGSKITIGQPFIDPDNPSLCPKLFPMPRAETPSQKNKDADEPCIAINCHQRPISSYSP